MLHVRGIKTPYIPRKEIHEENLGVGKFLGSKDLSKEMLSDGEEPLLPAMVLFLEPIGLPLLFD